jgi:hypothetical protein
MPYSLCFFKTNLSKKLELQRKENGQKVKSKSLFGLAGPLLHIHFFTLKREMRARNVSFLVSQLPPHKTCYHTSWQISWQFNKRKKYFKKDWAA